MDTTPEMRDAFARIQDDAAPYIIGETEDGLAIVQRDEDGAVFLVDAAGDVWRADWTPHAAAHAAATGRGSDAPYVGELEEPRSTPREIAANTFPHPTA